MDKVTKKRLAVFGAGGMIGIFLSVLLFMSFDMREPKRDVEEVTVAMTRCNLEVGDVLREECVETKSAAYYLVPPKSLRAKDVDWHLGRELTVSLDAGSVLRTVDFAPENDTATDGGDS